MIIPKLDSTDYLDFECDKCENRFNDAIRISHDAPTDTDAQRYDVRNWTIMRIHLQCPSCHDTREFKLSLMKAWAKK